MTPLDLDGLDELLARHGATQERWPEALRESAQTLLATDPRAHRRWHQALELEALLDDWAIPEPAGDLALRIAASAPTSQGFGEVLQHACPGLWQGALLTTVPLLIGFVIAITQVDPGQDLDRRASAELAYLSAYGLLGSASGSVSGSASGSAAGSASESVATPAAGPEQ